MARHGITYSDVAAAASQLTAAGSVPTIDTIRAALGHTGSKSTIGPLLKRWREAHETQVMEANTGLPAELLHGVQAVYQALQQSASVELAQARQAHQDETTALQEQITAQLAECELVRTQHNVVAQELAIQMAQISQLTLEQQAQAQQIAAFETAYQALQQRLADRSEALAQMTRQMTAARDQFDHYQEVVAQQRAEERQVAEGRIAGLERELHEARRQVAAKDLQLGEQQGEMRQMSRRHRELTETCTLAQTELAQLRPAQAQLTETLADRTAALAFAASEKAAQQERLQQLETALSLSQNDQAASAARLLLAETKIEQLLSEKWDLVSANARLDQQLQMALPPSQEPPPQGGPAQQ